MPFRVTIGLLGTQGCVLYCFVISPHQTACPCSFNGLHTARAYSLSWLNTVSEYPPLQLLHRRLLPTFSEALLSPLMNFNYDIVVVPHVPPRVLSLALHIATQVQITLELAMLSCVR
ncbi:hypothetical protein CANCADRAFT_102927 [Tortispora caseinolytica NRRL Y-17796]|uniref:Secreted protein n=1 Tax=Tortispora caseinolytica NRRL Y-17796 TaxID=767744 RepID=A0A1E4TEL7_9ASCO|nr:hypothetical protein CANCADRAFT_102927 [Tortispora caseinolytica NRRL Y-17796]